MDPSYPFGISPVDSPLLNFLIISDIHLNFKKLEKLKNWFFSTSPEKIDYVLILGDFDNIKQTTPEIDKIVCAKSESNISNILAFLEFFAVPMFYIPGNHDSFSLFVHNPEVNPFDHKKLTQSSTNLHLTRFQINKDLQIVGLGGAIPAFKLPIDEKKPFYEGFPYQNDSEFKKDIEKIQEFFSENLQTILITHNGPTNSSTAIDYSSYPKEPIYFGSNGLFEVLQGKNNILVNCHGHIHDGAGRARINNIDVINPGSLGRGDFCTLTIVRNSVGNKWIVKNMNFLSLDGFN